MRLVNFKMNLVKCEIHRISVSFLMNLRLAIFVLTFLTGSSAFACMNTFQRKIFPIGVADGKILALQVEILRTSIEEGRFRYGLEAPDGSEYGIMWMLVSSQVELDKTGKSVFRGPVDTTFAISESYSAELADIFSAHLNQARADLPQLELFTPEYASDCEYQKTCERVTLISDSARKADFLLVEGKEIPAAGLAEAAKTSHERLSTEPPFALYLDISTVRIFNTSSLRIMVVHLGQGEDLYDEEYVQQPEHKADFPFVQLENSTFEEPILHHAWGTDILVTLE